MKVKTHLIGKYRIVCDKYGEIITLRFKNSAIEYLVKYCGVLTKNITVQEG